MTLGEALAELARVGVEETARYTLNMNGVCQAVLSKDKLEFESDNWRDCKVWIAARVFERQMRWLAENVGMVEELCSESLQFAGKEYYGASDEIVRVFKALAGAAHE